MLTISIRHLPAAGCVRDKNTIGGDWLIFGTPSARSGQGIIQEVGPTLTRRTIVRDAADYRGHTKAYRQYPKLLAQAPLAAHHFSVRTRHVLRTTRYSSGLVRHQGGRPSLYVGDTAKVPSSWQPGPSDELDSRPFWRLFTRADHA